MRIKKKNGIRSLLRKPKLAIQSFILNTLADSLMWKALIAEVEGANSSVTEINKDLYFCNRDIETMYDSVSAIQSEVTSNKEED